MNVFIYLTFGLMLISGIAANLGCKKIRTFVDSHNSRRRLIAKGQVKGQPPASEMKSMIWDQELHEKASAWAARNQHKHNPDKSIPSGRFRTGENLYWYSTTDRNYKLNPESAIESWFSEHVNYTYGPLRSRDFDGSQEYQIGHYTQLVWSDSIFVGCAVSQTFQGRWNNFFVVCNYGPTGNYLNSVPYRKGRPSKKLVCGCEDDDERCNCKRPYGNQC